MPISDPKSGGRRVYVGLKCNDCGERYRYNRNLNKRRKCEVCGCQWLEKWSEWLPDDRIAQMTQGEINWDAQWREEVET